ncbi:hypothetical protein D9M71_550960 [compost metagenome]
MAFDAVQLAGRQACIDHHRPGIQAAQGEQGGDQQAAVLGHQHDPVASPHAILDQLRLQQLDGQAQLTVTEGDSAFMHGRAGGVFAAMAVQQQVQALRQFGNDCIALKHQRFSARRIRLRAITSCWICVVPS